jgi:hypothetical protein
MKHVILIIALFVISKSLFAQKIPVDTNSKKVTFVYINNFGENAGFTKLFNVSKEWFQSKLASFNRSNSEKNADGAATFFGVRKGKSQTVDILYKVESPLKYSDTSSKKMIGSGVLKYTGGNYGCIRVLYIEFDLNIYVKDGKSKLEVTNLRYTHYNQINFTSIQMYGFDDSPPCNSKNSFEEGLMACDHCSSEKQRLYQYLIDDFQNLNTEYKTYVNQQLNAKDDW